MKELDVAIAAARAAGEITERHFARKTVASTDKAPGHPVTDADIESNQLIKDMIRREFPNDGWLSEECADSEDRLTKKRVWIIDPIDGTKEFIAGVPEYVISIGLVIDGEPVLGVVFQPTQNRLFHGIAGWNDSSEPERFRTLPDYPGDAAFLGEERLSIKRTERASSNVATQAKTPRILVSRTETSKGLWDPYKGQFELIPCGSISYKICRIAAGEADGAITLNPRSEWDIAGAAAILRAAGGMLADHNGNKIAWNRPVPVTPTGIIAGTEEFVKRAVEMLYNPNSKFEARNPK